MAPEENDVLSETKTDDMLPTEMELFWKSILTAKEALEDAVNHLRESASSDRPGEITNNTEHFSTIRSSTQYALRELKEVEGERRI